jgi:hypothetical protein
MTPDHIWMLCFGITFIIIGMFYIMIAFGVK